MKHINKKTLSAYIDNETNSNKSKIIKEHIANCSKCSKEYNKLKQIKNALHILPKIELNKTESFEHIINKINLQETDEKSSFINKLHDLLNYHLKPVAAFATSAVIALIIFAISSTNNSIESNSLPINFEKPVITKITERSVAEKETDEIIKNYENMSQLYYY